MTTPKTVSPPTAPAVLLAEESLPYRRVIREALMAFHECEVYDTPSGEHAFEVALRRPCALFIFSLTLPDMAGDLLDRMVARAYPLAHPKLMVAPPIIYLARSADSLRVQALQRDARFRGSLAFPPKLDALLALTERLLPKRQPGSVSPL